MENAKNNILANLLAQERLRVEHRKTKTAYFMLKERLLVLPMFGQKLDECVYTMMVAHEVGHALYTPTEGWHNAVMELPKKLSNGGRGFKSFLNVVEDARIERKIKYRYPGLRREFFSGYTILYKEGFFGRHKINDLLLIDRINLYYKAGAQLIIPFSQEERKFLTKIDAAQTWDEVVNISIELYEYCKQEMQDREDDGEKPSDDDQDDLDDWDDLEDSDCEGGEGSDKDGDNESDKESDKGKKKKVNYKGAGKDYKQDDLESLTDKAFREKESSLTDANAVDTAYAMLPILDPRDYIIGVDKVANHFSIIPAEKRKGSVIGDWWEKLQTRNLHREFLDRNNKYISYLVKEFELRKNAGQLAKAKISKTGDIDVNKLYSYKFNNEIFKSITVIPNGKNHGLLMLVDWSGSMDRHMGAVLEQVLCMVHFCRKVGIPHRVYAFLSYRLDKSLSGLDNAAILNNPKEEENNSSRVLVDRDFSLATLFSDKMSRQQFAKISQECYVLIEGRKETEKNIRAYVHFGGMHLSGTPLNEAVVLMRYIISDFKKQYKLDVVNTMVLTDGCGNCLRVSNTHCSAWQYSRSMVYVDPITKKEKKSRPFITVRRGREDAETAQLRAIIELIREATGTNMIGFFVANTMGDIAHMIQMNNQVNNADADESVLAKVKADFRNNKFLALQDLGYNEFYIVKGGDLTIEDEDFVRKENEKDSDKKPTKAKIFKAFLNNQNKKQFNRILLNRLIKQIS